MKSSWRWSIISNSVGLLSTLWPITKRYATFDESLWEMVSNYEDTSYLLKTFGCLLNHSRLETDCTFVDSLQLLTLAVCTSWRFCSSVCCLSSPTGVIEHWWLWLSNTACMVVPCQLSFWLPLYTLAGLCRKLILSADAIVNSVLPACLLKLFLIHWVYQALMQYFLTRLSF